MATAAYREVSQCWRGDPKSLSENANHVKPFQSYNSARLIVPPF